MKREQIFKMKTEQVLLIAIVAMLIGWVYESHLTMERESSYKKEIQLQSDSIQTLNKRLQTSNEKRGRLFLALLYTDIKGREKSLDSLLIEIGKDN